jgi:peptidoglycan/xylan/chitin deacetylase (PgdA/CDA1 family)
VPILTYHEISKRPAPTYRHWTVTPDEFSDQMSWLAGKGYTSLNLDQLMECRAGRAPLPPRPVVLTFDDGCQECVDHATAILPQHGFTGVFYLVTGYMGGVSTWMKERRNVELPLIDWQTARDLAASGFSCGSHTVSHHRLGELSLAQSREELARSRATLQDRLGQDIVHLSYPYGSFSPDVRTAAAEAGYQTAVTIQLGLSDPSDDPLALHRINIGGDETFRDFKLRVRTSKRVDELLPKPVYAVASGAKRLIARVKRRVF